MRLKSVSVTDDSDMDDNAKQLRKTFRKPTLQQIKKAAARVILGTRDSEGRSRVNSSEFQDDMANLEGLRYKLELAKQLENSDNAKTLYRQLSHRTTAVRRPEAPKTATRTVSRKGAVLFTARRMQNGARNNRNIRDFEMNVPTTSECATKSNLSVVDRAIATHSR